MLLIREIMNCKPGKVKAMVEKSLAMAKIMEKHGQGKMRTMTDVAGEQYWSVIMEFEVKDLGQFEAIMAGAGASEAMMKEMEGVMKGYHDLLEKGRREIWKIEG